MSTKVCKNCGHTERCHCYQSGDKDCCENPSDSCSNFEPSSAPQPSSQLDWQHLCDRVYSSHSEGERILASVVQHLESFVPSSSLQLFRSGEARRNPFFGYSLATKPDYDCWSQVALYYMLLYSQWLPEDLQSKILEVSKALETKE